MLHPTIGKSHSTAEKDNKVDPFASLEINNHLERLRSELDHQQINQNPLFELSRGKRMHSHTFSLPYFKLSRIEKDKLNNIENIEIDPKEKPCLKKLL